MTDVLPGAEPFSSSGAADGEFAGAGALVLHGFSGSPQSMRPWAQALADAGLTVRLPLLPGHGTSWQDMAGTRWSAWYGEAERAFDDLAGRCTTVVVCGLSMGGTLTLRLAETKGSAVAGAVTVNASLTTPDWRLRLLPVLTLPVVRSLIPAFPGIGSDIKRSGVTELAYPKVPLRAVASLLELQASTLSDLGRITSPVLAFRSIVDHVVAPVSGQLLRERTGPGIVREQLLTESFHVATLDNDAPTIVAGSLDVVRARVAARGSAAGQAQP